MDKNGNAVISSELIPELFSVRDKVVFITGAGGLGVYYARAFAKNGAKIAIGSRNKQKLTELCDSLTKQGYCCRSYVLDVADEDNVERTVSQVEADFGRIDVLIHTPGIAILDGPMQVKSEDMRKTMDVNFYGCYFVNVAVARIMVKNGWGRIININSIDSFAVNCADATAYDVSKAAMLASTRALAVELAQTGVTVNGIAPVWIWTPMMEGRPKDYMVQAAATIPMGRVSYSEDYLGIAVFLASEASAYVTGQTFLVDGGWACNRIFKYKED